MFYIQINGIPYCQCEQGHFAGQRAPDTGKALGYPTNCSHDTRESAEEGASACRARLPQGVNCCVVQGVCPAPRDGDGFWPQPHGERPKNQTSNFTTNQRLLALEAALCACEGTGLPSVLTEALTLHLEAYIGALYALGDQRGQDECRMDQVNAVNMLAACPEAWGGTE